MEGFLKVGISVALSRNKVYERLSSFFVNKFILMKRYKNVAKKERKNDKNVQRNATYILLLNT